jgi:hypothetical protein
MKAIIKIILIFVISLMATACTTTPVTPPEKYNLDNELVEVTQICKFREINWETVDNQSIILRSGPTDYYLIVLLQPSHSLVFSEAIGISDTNDMIKAGYDHVVVKDSGGTNSYIIHKIYKLEDRHQAQEIKKRMKMG